jgi:hypothetical protein
MQVIVIYFGVMRYLRMVVPVFSDYGRLGVLKSDLLSVEKVVGILELKVFDMP